MPKINLRLTDEEHEALKAWAQDSHRSIQREAVFRLFSERSLSERDGAHVAEVQNPVTDGRAVGRQVPTPSVPTSRSESDFKPDFK